MKDREGNDLGTPFWFAEMATCDLCRFFEPHRTVDGKGLYTLGDCRRHPPRIAPDGVDGTTSWPLVSIDDWCGEWAADRPVWVEEHVREWLTLRGLLEADLDPNADRGHHADAE